MQCFIRFMLSLFSEKLLILIRTLSTRQKIKEANKESHHCLILLTHFKHPTDFPLIKIEK